MPTLVFGTKGVAKTIAEAEAIAKAVEQQTKATDKLSMTQRRMDSLAQQINRRQESAQDRLNRMLKTTLQLKQQGKISAEAYGKEVTKLKDEFVKAEGRFKDFGKAQEKVFSLDHLKTYAGAFAAGGIIGSAFALAKKMAEDVNATLDRAKQFTDQGKESIGSLGQLSGGDQKRFAELTAKARQFSRDAVVDEGVAGQAVFNVVSSSLEDYLGLFAKLKRNNTISDVSQFASAIRNLQFTFGDDPRAVAAKGFAAAKVAQGEVGQVLTKAAAAGAKDAGVGQDESLAALAVVSNQLGVDRGGTGLKGLFRALSIDPRFAGKTLEESVTMLRDLRAANTPQQKQAQLQKELADAQLEEGMRLASDYSSLYGSAFGVSPLGVGIHSGKLNMRLQEQYKKRLADKTTALTEEHKWSKGRFENEFFKVLADSEGRAGFNALEGRMDMYRDTLRQISAIQPSAIDRIGAQYDTPGEASQLREQQAIISKQLSQHTAAIRDVYETVLQRQENMRVARLGESGAYLPNKTARVYADYVLEAGKLGNIEDTISALRSGAIGKMTEGERRQLEDAVRGRAETHKLLQEQITIMRNQQTSGGGLVGVSG